MNTVIDTGAVDADPPGPESDLSVGGMFHVKCFDSHGNLKWQDTAKNGVVNSALDNLLDVYLRNQAQTATWYPGLISGTGFSALAAADTMGSHAGWTESSAYDELTRPAWTPGAASGQSITNGTAVEFTINAAATTIKGVFLASDSTKGGATGTLFATALFTGGDQVLGVGDVLQVTYTVNASSA